MYLPDAGLCSVCDVPEAFGIVDMVDAAGTPDDAFVFQPTQGAVDVHDAETGCIGDYFLVDGPFESVGNVQPDIPISIESCRARRLSREIREIVMTAPRALFISRQSVERPSSVWRTSATSSGMTYRRPFG